LTNWTTGAILQTLRQQLKGKQMTSKAAMFVFISGLLITFGAVGGIEVAQDEQLLGCMLFACLGLLTMYCGVLGLRNSDYYDGSR
jgi:hypothetical protein